MADITDIERLNYYEGEYLGAVDFEAEQEYHRDMRRRHNLGPHTWGIVTGLDVAQFPNGGPNNEVDVYIQPGTAIDGFGREMVVFSPYQLTTDLFADFPQKQLLSIWIGYSQQMIQPASDACTPAGQSNAFSRVLEGFQIVIDPLPPTSDPVMIDGNPVQPPSTTGWTQPATLPPLPSNPGDVILPLDFSIPFQALPDDNTTANWLVPLGLVMWDGPNQRLLQIAPAIANSSRQYASIVASVLYAPAGSLTIQDRSTPSPLPTAASGVATEIQGTLTVDRLLTAEADVWINGGTLYFKEPGGGDGDTVLDMQRIDGASGGADLHINIGDNIDKLNKPQRLTVGYRVSGSTTDTNVFIVKADGSAEIPKGSLFFGTQQAQVLNLSGTDYGIGVQTSTLYSRSPADFAWYVGGTYSQNQDDPGGGGSVSMLLGSSGDLTVKGALAIDHADANNASINPGLTFGLASGEGIASKRTAGGNRYGLDFYTNSTVRMNIDNSGHVGIGTAGPDAQLNLGGGAWDLTNTEGDLKIGNDSFRLKMGVALGGGGAGDARIRAVGGTNRLMLGTGTADVLTISGSDVGIGTTSPDRPLAVQGAGGGQELISFKDSGGITKWHLNLDLANSHPGCLNFAETGVADGRLFLKPGGNIGIGTTAPEAQLHLTGGAWDLNISEGDLKIGNDTYRMKMSVALVGIGAGDTRIRAAGGTNRLLLGSGTSDVLTIAGNKVGVNNIAPTHALDVTGNFNCTGSITAGGSKSGYVVERFVSRTKKPLSRGDVVVLHAKPSAIYYGMDKRIPIIEVTLATKANDTRVCGIVDEPVLAAELASGMDLKAVGTGNVGLMVTLGAYAFCKVDADIAPIEPGDLLTTSQTAGHAQKLDTSQGVTAGSMIGKALGGLNKGKGTIPILVSHQ